MKNVYKKEAKILLDKRGQGLWDDDYNYGVRFEFTESGIEVYQSAFVMGGGGVPQYQDKKEPSYILSFEEFYNKYNHHYEGVL